MRIDDATALVTGASSGIGRALALGLLARGAHLALVDRDAEGLARLNAILKPTLKRRVTTHVVDVADRAAVHALPMEIRAAHGGLDLLVNNAGVALGGTFEETSEEDFEWLLSINLVGLTRMTRACLPLLKSRPQARIVNLSSLFGIIAPPGQAAYAASKYAVRGFSDALRHEFAGTGLGVTCVHPGGVATSIVANARLPRTVDPIEAARRARAFAALLRLPPQRAADIIISGIERDRDRVVVGRDAWLGILLERLMPVRYWRCVDLLSRAGAKRGA